MRQAWITAVFLSLALAAGAAAAADESAAAPEAVFHRLERLWNEAHIAGDIPTLDKLWADDLTVIVPTMKPMGKQALLQFWKESQVRFTRYDTSGLEVKLLGDDAAVVTGRLLRSRAFAGKVATEDWQFTKVYVRKGDDWRVTAFHASEAPQ